MRLIAASAVLLVAIGLSACTAPSRELAGDARSDDALYEANVRTHVDAMAAGMARARLDLARRALRRMLEDSP